MKDTLKPKDDKPKEKNAMIKDKKDKVVHDEL